MSNTFNLNKYTKLFVDRLTETIAWCSQRGLIDDPQNSLRTLQLRRSFLMLRDLEVLEVIQERTARLQQIKSSRAEAVTNLCGGRLLAFDPDQTLSDGAAEVETKGFFDVHNVPPYDTWVDYIYEEVFEIRTKLVTRPRRHSFSSYLVAWIPPQFLDLVNAGIEVNPEVCLQWLDTMDSPFANTLQRINLLL